MSNEYRMLYVGYWLRRFLSEYLVTVRNMSKNTIKSYRDTFKLLLPFAAKPCKKTTDDLLLTDISISRVVSFLNMLEKERKCTIRTQTKGWLLYMLLPNMSQFILQIILNGVQVSIQYQSKRRVGV